MPEPWLQTNQRLRTISLVIVAVLEALVTVVAMWAWLHEASTPVLAVLGSLWISSQLALVAWAIIFRVPRISYEPGFLNLHLRWLSPVRVPIELVEGFLLGQGPTLLPGASADWETSTLVVKLSDRAAEWQKVDVARAMAAWCNSYVTIRGTWCEPLDVGVVNRLNLRLSEVKPARSARVRT